ncbi:MAG: GAF domain-containing protein [Acidobacteria bacterium]|jgi:DNA-binding CsgD family transcriptional regulator|nr:GAF domain-containing protein [Acidobacteriota bacterium]MEB2350028.1 LuxR C-terminal-related transcriptional regulator [Burkholderiaceae bacterium]
MRSRRSTVSGSSALVNTFLAGLVGLVGAHSGIVRLRMNGSDQSRLIAAYGLPTGALAYERSISDPCGICGEALRRNRVRVADRKVRRGTIHAALPELQSCPATVAVSLNQERRALGVLTLFFEDERPLSRELVALLRPVGELLALAIASPASLADRDMPLLGDTSLQRTLFRALVSPETPEPPPANSARCTDSSDEPPPDPGSTGREQDPTPVLTEREREVLDKIALGLSNKSIARALDISHETVKVHLRHIFTKLGFSSRAEAMLFASRK